MAVLTAAVVSACGSGGKASIGNGSSATTASGAKVAGGTATMAWVAASPNFVFPLPPATNTNGYNANLTLGIWPDLVVVGDGGQSAVNTQESLFSSLKYSDGDKVERSETLGHIPEVRRVEALVRQLADDAKAAAAAT